MFKEWMRKLLHYYEWKTAKKEWENYGSDFLQALHTFFISNAIFQLNLSVA